MQLSAQLVFLGSVQNSPSSVWLMVRNITDEIDRFRLPYWYKLLKIWILGVPVLCKPVLRAHCPTSLVCCLAGELQENSEAGWRRPQALQWPDRLLPGACQDREGLFPAAEWLGQEMEGCCGERWSGLWDLVWGHRGSPCCLKITCYPNWFLVVDTTDACFNCWFPDLVTGHA